MTSPHPSVAHIGIAVTNIDEAASFFTDVLGISPGHEEHSDGARIRSLHFGDTEIELLEPESPDGPISRFLEKRGPGIHHICLRVPDIGAALDACRAKGYKLVDDEPRTGAHGRRVAFVHPKSTSGILLELTD